MSLVQTSLSGLEEWHHYWISGCISEVYVYFSNNIYIKLFLAYSHALWMDNMYIFGVHLPLRFILIHTRTNIMRFVTRQVQINKAHLQHESVAFCY